MEETLEQGLDVLFGRAPPSPVTADLPTAGAAPGTTPPAAQVPVRPPPQPVTGDAAALMRQARQHYDQALAAQRSGDWARYGQEIQRLGEVLRRMEAR
jgi:uncharacterized membrane protein (UPF0182 family)